MEAEVLDAEVEHPVDTGADAESEQPAVDGAEPTPEAETATETPEAEPKPEDFYAGKDGKDIPEKLRPIFKQHPELKSMFFENREVRRAGGARALIEAAKTVAEVGGRDGIAAAQAELREWQDVDAQFVAGDPGLVERLATLEPEGFAKLAAAAFEKLPSVNPELYSHIAARALYGTMRDLQVFPALRDIEALVDKHPELKSPFERLANLWNTVYDLAQKTPEKQVDPERQKLEQERQQLENDKLEAFASAVKGEARAYMESAIERELTQQFSKAGVDIKKLRDESPDSFEDLVAFCDRRIAKAMTSDPEFVRVRDARWKAGDRAGLTTLVRKKIDAIIGTVGKQARDHFSRLGGGSTAAPARRQVAAADPGRTAPGVVRLAKSPSESGLRIDWSRVPKGYSSVEDAMFDNKAFVHGRKELVTW